MKPRALFGLFALKLSFTAAAIWFVATRIDVAGALSALSAMDRLFVAAAMACALFQVWLASVRFVAVSRLVGIALPHGPALRFTFIGGFFGQAFATFVSGDLTRVWLLARSGAGYQAAGNAVLLDRVFGVAGLVVLILLGLPPLLAALPSETMRAGALLAAAGSVAGIGGFLLLGVVLHPNRSLWKRFSNPKLAWLAELAGAARYVLAAPMTALLALAIGLAIQVVSVINMYLLFRAIEAPVSVATCFMFVPFVMLITMLPLSFAGWGLREGAMVAGFALVGIAAETTLVVSIAFGLIILVTSLPGLPLWLLSDARQMARGMPQKNPDMEQSRP